MNIIIISTVNKYNIIIFVMRTTSFSTMLLIMIIIFSGAVITITVSLTDALAFSDKIDQKLIQQKDDNNNNNNNQKNYQQLYKQYDFEKYLNYHYMYIPQYNDNRDSNSNDDTSKKNPFAAAAIDNNNFNDKKDNNKQLEQQSNSEKDEDKAEYILELNDRKDFADHKKYSSDKDDKKTYKNIKIVECKNFNINAYEIEDLKSIETLLTKPTTFENNDDDDDDDDSVSNQQVKSHNEKSSKEAKEYDINSNTKVIFICNNENHEIRPINSNNLTQPLTNDGILLPTHSPNNHNNNNNNNNGENKPITTTISYAQYKKSISND
jgi:selenocysteine insertion sequence-binding protein 2